jgi:hypothetical protein
MVVDSSITETESMGEPFPNLFGLEGREKGIRREAGFPFVFPIPT